MMLDLKMSQIMNWGVVLVPLVNKHMVNDILQIITFLDAFIHVYPYYFLLSISWYPTCLTKPLYEFIL